MSFQRLVLQILASTPSFQRFVLWLRLASTELIPAFGTSDTREYPVISAFATPATREYSVISAFDTLATTREYLSHFSVWYFRYSRVHRRFSVWYSGYDSRVLISFRRSVHQILASTPSFQLLGVQVLASTLSIQIWVPQVLASTQSVPLFVLQVLASTQSFQLWYSSY